MNPNHLLNNVAAGSASPPIASQTSEPQKLLSRGHLELSLALLVSAVLLIVAIVLQRRFGTIPDASWLITVCERVLDGQRLYIDVIDTNPPFSIWLYMPAVIASRWIGMVPEIGIEIYSYLAVMVGLGLSAIIIRRAGFPENLALRRLLPLFMALCIILPGNSFTERDQLGAVLFLPMLAMMAWRADDATFPVRGIGLIAATGLFGSVLLLVKPYYVVVYVVPAMFVVWRRRSIRSLFALENCMVGFAGILYVALIFWIYPQFIYEILPRVADVYLNASDPLQTATNYAPFVVALMFFLWRVAPNAPVRPICAVTSLASFAAFAVLVYQGKGWPYHAFPAISFALVAILCRVAAYSGWRFDRETLVRMTFLAFISAFAALPFLYGQKLDDAFVSAIKSASPSHPTLGVIGSDLAAGHPLSRMIEARFLSANNSDWEGALAYALSVRAAAHGDNAAADRYKAEVGHYLDEKYAEFTKYNYDLIVIQQDETQWRNYILGQPRFSTALLTYHPIANSKRFTVYSRNAPASKPQQP